MNFGFELTPDFGRQLARDLESARQDWHDGMEGKARAGLHDVSPVDEGEFQASWEEAQRASGALTEYRNKAPHAFAIDPGRRPGKTRRMLGSRKAPRGVSYVVGRELGRESEDVLAEALRKQGVGE
ncbi:MAG TPA: hypothetical protein VLT87_10995 [Thermoanaerobaculia bacterium]|nr:hypothetical protein [Thermoanaerobaculia bacterium]